MGSIADCPMCNSKMIATRYNFITNSLGLTNPYFKCPMCRYKITVKEVHKRGGLDNVKRHIQRGRSNRKRKGNARGQKRRGKQRRRR